MRAKVSTNGLVLVPQLLLALIAALDAQEQNPVSLSMRLFHGPPVGETIYDNCMAGARPDTVFDQGEPIDVLFVIENRGDEPVRYTLWSPVRSVRQDAVMLEVVDEQGRVLPDPRCLWDPRGQGSAVPRTLRPGEFHGEVYLNQWVMPLAPGRYMVTGVFRDLRDRAEPKVLARSASARIEIRARSQAEMQAYIDQLGLELQQEDAGEERDRLRHFQAASYLGFTGDLAALPHLTAAVYDPDREVAFAAQEAFIYLEDRAACAGALLAALEQQGPPQNFMLYWLLEGYKVPRAQTLAPTVKGLSDPIPQRRLVAALALGQYYRGMGDAALAPLLTALEDEDALVRSAVAAALGYFSAPQVTEPLLAASNDPEERVRASVLDALGRVKAVAAVPRLQAGLRDTPSVAGSAAGALLYIATPEAVEAVAEALPRLQGDYQLRTAIGLLRLGCDEGVEVIAAVLEDALVQESLAEAEGRRHQHWPDAQRISRLLAEAVRVRGIPGPTDEADYASGEAWLAWLRQRL